MNVKNRTKGLNKKILTNSHERKATQNRDIFKFFFLKWLLAWEEIPGDCGKLSKETFTALWNTCYGLLSEADYCLSELKLNYVLVGKFQTDCHILVNIANFLVGSIIFRYEQFMKVRKDFTYFLL